MFDVRTHCDYAANAFRAHNGRQTGPITIAARNHQKIVLVDRRGLDRNHLFARSWRADVRDIGGLQHVGRLAKSRDLNSFHAFPTYLARPTDLFPKTVPARFWLYNPRSGASMAVDTQRQPRGRAEL